VDTEVGTDDEIGIQGPRRLQAKLDVYGKQWMWDVVCIGGKRKRRGCVVVRKGGLERGRVFVNDCPEIIDTVFR